MTSTRPYLLRAIYQWIVDNDMTPHLLAATTNDDIRIPRQYEDNGKIVLNIGPTAVNGLNLDDEVVSFDARFDGKAMSVMVPIKQVLAIYTRENGRGLMFGDEDDDMPPPDDDGQSSSEAKPAKPNLKVVK